MKFANQISLFQNIFVTACFAHKQFINISFNFVERRLQEIFSITIITPTKFSIIHVGWGFFG
jgi:hypothetical protein